MEFHSSRYEILSEIGQGGWSTVYRARHLALDKIVAVKLLHQHLATDSKLLKRFEQEAQIASSLVHPNIVEIIDYGATPQPFIVMEYLEGHSLSELLENGYQLSVVDTIEISLAICAGLSVAHSRGVIHRDIKPSNIFLVEPKEQPRRAKILDFGLSKPIDGDDDAGSGITRTGEALGSPPYMSPEQWSGKEIDARSDIYSFGCLLYEVIAGKPAFPGSSALECMNRHLTELPEGIIAIRPELSEGAGLDRIVFKAISKNPTSRYKTIEQLSSDLQQLKQGKKLLYAEKRRHHLIEWLKWRKTIILRIFAVAPCIALVALTVAYFYREEITNNIWSFNFKSGEQALALKDYKTADLRLSTALNVLDLTGAKDKRTYWTIKRLALALKAERKWPRLAEMNKRSIEFTRAGHQCEVLQAESAKEYHKGNTAIALKLCLEAIAEAKKTSPENLAIAENISNLGVMLWHTGKSAEGIRVLKESLRIEQDWLGKDHLATAKTEGNLGGAYWNAHKYQEAKQALSNALAVELRLAPNSPQTADTLHSLGLLSSDMNDLAGAVDYYKRSIQIYEKATEFDNAQLSTAIDNLGITYVKLGRYKEAEAQFQKALAVIEKWYGPNHLYSAVVLTKFSYLRSLQNNLDDAVTLQEQALKIRTESLGANDPLTIQTRAIYDKMLQLKRSNKDNHNPKTKN